MKELDIYIAIEGPIGVGKTSLAKLIADKLNARKVFEKFEENPFLKDFYDDPESNAFQTQIFFLLQRYQQQQKDIRQLIGQILSDEGYQVCLASNSEAAMAEINSKSPDLIILDIWLKDSNMDGIEILKTVRSNDKNIPVVIISGELAEVIPAFLNWPKQ